MLTSSAIPPQGNRMSATLSPAIPAVSTPLLRRAAVLGAGTMGSRIAAHLANAGIPVVLLDIVPAEAKFRSQVATTAVAALLKSRPAAFYESSAARLITPGNFEDDLNLLTACDWSSKPSPKTSPSSSRC